MAGASSMTSLNSTCVAIDITFTNGTALRNLGVKDQFGNTLNPASECSHLQPDQWNTLPSTSAAWPDSRSAMSM
jgi:hypothetical protein